MSVFHSCIIVIPMKKSDYELLLFVLAVQYQYLVHGSSSGPYPGSKGCVCTCKRHTEALYVCTSVHSFQSYNTQMRRYC